MCAINIHSLDQGMWHVWRGSKYIHGFGRNIRRKDIT